ncbi:CHAT domain-containing protein [Rhodoferax sp. GW822-FHT02A01]|uniref:CHAT domain-containing protein n=1 Tax=Rhodoferax sp. GW822-FHT02A01 TaxID=3141537 RepID=UPI00315D670A
MILRRLIRATVIVLALAALSLHAQEEDYASSFKVVNAQEREVLRGVLAEPVPVGVPDEVLAEHFQKKRNAADRLGEFEAREKVYQQWAQALPDSFLPKHLLAGLLEARGDFGAALPLRHEVLKLTKTEQDKAYYRQVLASTLFAASRFDEARQVNEQVRASLPALKAKYTKPLSLQYLLRTESAVLELDAQLQRKYGHWPEAVASATEAVDVAREALRTLRSVPSSGDGAALNRARIVVASLGTRMGTRTATLLEARRFGEAENSLREFARLSREEELPPIYLSSINRFAGSLSLNQRQFIRSEEFFRKADKVFEDLGYPQLHRNRMWVAQFDLAALIGQRRWDAALKELDRLDAAAGNDPVQQRRVRLQFERGLVYLGAGVRTEEAATLFAELLGSVGRRFPEHHFYIAQAQGLRGVALWRTGTPQNKTQATALLQGAVRDYMLPDNLEYESLGVRKDVRDLVFSTYLDAMFQGPSAGAMDAMTPADWVRGGLVQEAISDAAVRSAAVDPNLNDLVRQDQNAKNEMEALRNYLAGEDENSSSALPETAARMRERITALESVRLGLQKEIRRRFPDYDRLVHPNPATTDDITKALAPDEALIMLQPTAAAVYAWAVAADGSHTAVRVPWEGAALAAKVRSLRKTLDFSEMGSRMTSFDAKSSAEIYQQLLKPLEPTFAGKKHLVIAAGGALGQIPFGLLLTQPTASAGADAPWLIRRYAVTHVPSLGSWLSIQKLARSKPAAEALIAWGDPQFSTAKGPAAKPATTRHVTLTRAAVASDLEQAPAGALRYGDIPELPETRDELLSIARALRADSLSDLHLGAQATKTSVLQSNASGELVRKRVVAFATHGLMAGDLPHLTQPALALAAAGASDGNPLSALLGLDEVLNLKLNADWVVLSACNTAAADGKGDEALSGLARGFFYAGSRSLLVTHWAVESESAKELTSRTMQHYAASAQERKAESLRQAMIEVMAMPQFQHPAFWAPYALVGDGGR